MVAVSLNKSKTNWLTFFLFFMRLASRLSWAFPGALDPHKRSAILAYTKEMMQRGVRYCTNTSTMRYDNMATSDMWTFWQNGFTWTMPPVKQWRIQAVWVSEWCDGDVYLSWWIYGTSFLHQPLIDFMFIKMRYQCNYEYLRVLFARHICL